jgi:cytochrome c556
MGLPQGHLLPRRESVSLAPGLSQQQGYFVKKIVIAGLILAAFGTAAAIADIHEDRESVMKSNGAALKALSGIIAATPFDAAAAKAQTQILIDNSAKIPGLFAPGSENADQSALPTVWSDAAGFKAASAKLGTDAAAAQAATDGTTLAAAIKTVQTDCGACHTAYRAPRKAAPAPAPQ